MPKTDLDDPIPRCRTCDITRGGWFNDCLGSLNFGRCQKAAPASRFNQEGKVEGGWPIVAKTDFCGEHPDAKKNIAVEYLKEMVDELRQLRADIAGFKG